MVATPFSKIFKNESYFCFLFKIVVPVAIPIATLLLEITFITISQEL